MTQRSNDVSDLAKRQAERWKNNPYYDDAERHMARHWENIVFPMIQSADFSNVLEIASGHGRNSEFLLPLCDSLILSDVNQENIDFCKNRFSGRDSNIRYLVNDGSGFADIDTSSISLVYCYDSMVHFHSDVVRSYLSEIKRVLRSDGLAFLHHSNSVANPGGLDISKHVQGRNFMSKEMFAHYAVLEGLSVVQQKVLDWGGSPAMDCITLLVNQES